MKRKIILEAEVVENPRRLDLKFGKFADDEYTPTPEELVSMMTNGLSLSVKNLNQKLDYKEQGELVKGILEYLENEFFNGESYKDLYSTIND